MKKVVQIRKELVNKYTFAGRYKDNEQMWQDISYYIDCTYDKNIIENIFIMGDGASYIKEGLNWLENSKFVLDKFHLKKYINHLNHDKYLKQKLEEAVEQYDPVSTENILKKAIKNIEKDIEIDKVLGRDVKKLVRRLEKVKKTKTYLSNQWDGIEIYEKYGDIITGCCQEGQIHHVLSSRMSTDAKVWSEDGIDKMSQLRAFTLNGGNIYKKIIDISTKEKKDRKLDELEKRIKRKAKKILVSYDGVKIPKIEECREELRQELEKIWYGRVI